MVLLDYFNIMRINKEKKVKQHRIFTVFLCVLATGLLAFSTMGCDLNPEAIDDSPEEATLEELLANTPDLDFSMVPADPVLASSRALDIPDSDTGKAFIDSVMGEKMYADAMNELLKWIRANTDTYTPDARHVLNTIITLDIPGNGETPFYLCTFAYTVIKNELKAYLFFPEPPSTDPTTTNPFRMYLSTKKNATGNYTSDLAWASYDDADVPEASSGDRDYLSTYFFRLGTANDKSIYFIKGSTSEYASYGELVIQDKANKFGSLKEASYDAPEGMLKNLVYSDTSGYYIHLDEEAGDFVDETDPNVGRFHLDRNFDYDSTFTDWPIAFTSLVDSWGGDTELALMFAYDPADYIPAFNDPMFKLIWPEEWQNLLTAGEL
jgi:hypothetical protein